MNDKMMFIKAYWSSAFSTMALVAYFSPWYADPNAALGYSLMGCFWFFLVGWIIMLLNLVFMVLKLKKKDATWKHYAISDAIILITYIALFWGIGKGYLLTV